jgi:hypothetical protein
MIVAERCGGRGRVRSAADEITLFARSGGYH